MSNDTFYFEVSPGATGSVTHNVRRAQFGDGYARITKGGINARNSSWQVAVGPMQTDEAAQVGDWLDSHAGQSFYWTPPGKIMPGRFMCSEYTLTPDVADQVRVEATFEEVFFP